MEQATIAVGRSPLRRPRLPFWTFALAVVIAYITLVTDDTYVARMPLKLFLVAATIGAWWWQVGRHRTLSGYSVGVPVLLFAMAIPVVWALVAAAHAVGGDAVGSHSFAWTMQECSRFVYLLLYFPLVDARRLLGENGVNLWLLPVLGLCFVTIVIFFSHYLTGSPTNSISFLIFKGVFQGYTGGFRVFIGNQVLFIAALALLFAQLAAYGPSSRFRIGGLTLLVVSAFLSHTRGIWLGMSVVCAGVLLVVFLVEMDSARRRALLGIAAGFALIASAIGVAVLAGAVPRPSFLADTSASLRVQQAPKLWDAFKQNPLVGDGLGAVVRPHFVRDPAAPWSYELTYLQLLFQMGVLGLLAVLSLPVVAICRGLGAGGWREVRALPVAGAMTIVGILAASATNPYLMSSFGMLGMAIGLSLIAPLTTPSAASELVKVGESP